MIEDLNKLNLYELNSNIDKTKDNDIVEIVKNSVYKFVTKRAFLLDFKGKGFEIVEPVEVEQVEQEIVPELVVQPIPEVIEPVQQIVTDIRLKDERIDNRVEDKRVDKKRIRKDV